MLPELLLFLGPLLQAPATPPRHDEAFWRSIVAAKFAVPAGESPAALLLELDTLLASPDPRLRDGCGYEIAAAWIYRDRAVGDAELRRVLRAWQANLGRGLGDSGDDGVLLRSFSALDLSVLAAADLKQPFLSPEDRAGLLESALDYLAREKDLRAYDPVKGWIHATAHTADLLKFLARADTLPASAATRIAAAIEAKLDAAPAVFTHGEDERLAAALLALLLRPDADGRLLDGWLARLRVAHAALWATGPLVDPSAYARVQNQKNTLAAVHLLLSQRARQAPLAPAALAAQAAILETLAGL